jgi:hypothetical protein
LLLVVFALCFLCFTLCCFFVPFPSAVSPCFGLLFSTFCFFCYLHHCRPSNIEDYIHRIGRTGRAGATGVAISFFTEKHSRLAKDLVEVLVKANQNVPKELQAFVPERGNGFGGGRNHYGGGNGAGNGTSAAGAPRTMVGSSTMKAYATSVGSRGAQRGDRYY